MTSPSQNKRKNMDVMKLMMSNYNVEMADDSGTDFYVDFQGPKETLYEGGEWKVHVNLPAEYPFRSPSVGFKNRIYHPNVDFRSGTICLDVINQTWSPMFDLINIFDVFLPQLLSYPNPEDPLNNEAAAMLIEQPEEYKSKVRELVQKYAKNVTNKKHNQCTVSDDVTKKEKYSVSSSESSRENVQPSTSLNTNITLNSKTNSAASKYSEDEVSENEDCEYTDGSPVELDFENTFDLEI